MTMVTPVMTLVIMMGLVTMMVRGSSVMTMGEVGRTLGMMGRRGVVHGAASAAGSVWPGVGGGPVNIIGH